MFIYSLRTMRKTRKHQNRLQLTFWTAVYKLECCKVWTRAVNCGYFAALMFTYFHFTEGFVRFSEKTIVASFLNVMILFCKMFINQFVSNYSIVVLHKCNIQLLILSIATILNLFKISLHIKIHVFILLLAYEIYLLTYFPSCTDKNNLCIHSQLINYLFKNF